MTAWPAASTQSSCKMQLPVWGLPELGFCASASTLTAHRSNGSSASNLTSTFSSSSTGLHALMSYLGVTAWLQSLALKPGSLFRASCQDLAAAASSALTLLRLLTQSPAVQCFAYEMLPDVLCALHATSR